MKKHFNILIVDDHPFIIEAYKNAIKRYSEQEFEFHITQAGDCKSGYDAIVQNTVPYDIVFFDISMPEYTEKGIFSGEDLALLMKKEMPNCKIILLTMHAELLKINNIVEKINPNGLIIKNDLTFDELLLAFDKIINNENYYSQTVIKLVGQTQFNNIELDVFDRQILFHLSKGIHTEKIPLYVPLTLSAVEKRKSNMKEVFDVLGDSDSELVKEAKTKGVI